MSPSKIKPIGMGLLLGILVLAAGGVIAYRSIDWSALRGKREQRSEPLVSTPQRLVYSPAEVVGDLRFPDDFTISVPHQIALRPKHLPNDPMQLANYATSRSLPQGAVVVTDPPSEYSALTALFRQKLDQSAKGELHVDPGSGLSVLIAGPMLMPYDGIEVRHFACHGKQIEMEIAYTAIPPRPRSKSWNVEAERWRPIVIVPLLLKAGSYRLKATWRKMDKLRDGKPLPAEPIVQTCSFIVPQVVVQSPALRVHGVDFQTLADGRCSAPAAGQQHSLHLGLRVTNRGEKVLLFESGGVLLINDSLRAADGSLFRYGGGRDITFRAHPVRVPPGQSHIFLVRGKLMWFNESGLQDVEMYKDGTGFFLGGKVGRGDTFWHYDGLAVGKYRLCFDYHFTSRTETYWTGVVRTQDIELEIVP